MSTESANAPLDTFMAISVLENVRQDMDQLEVNALSVPQTALPVSTLKISVQSASMVML